LWDLRVTEDGPGKEDAECQCKNNIVETLFSSTFKREGIMATDDPANQYEAYQTKKE
jgi:hypothetical protein